MGLRDQGSRFGPGCWRRGAGQSRCAWGAARAADAAHRSPSRNPTSTRIL